MKKFFSILAVVGLMVGVLVAGSRQTEVVNAEENNNTTTINVTMMNDCYDKEQFKGNTRVEQMFVVDVEYTDNEMYNVVTLEDTNGNLWEYEGIDLFLYDEVLVFMVDNNTEDITDDVIVHFWVGLE